MIKELCRSVGQATTSNHTKAYLGWRVGHVMRSLITFRPREPMGYVRNEKKERAVFPGAVAKC